MSPPDLEYVALVVDDPDATARVFERDFHLPRTEHKAGGSRVPVVSVGRSALANFLSRRGPGLAHVAFQTSDIDALLGQLSQEGWRMIDTHGRPGGRGSRIGFVHPSNFGGGLLIHFVERHKAYREDVPSTDSEVTPRV